MIWAFTQAKLDEVLADMSAELIEQGLEHRAHMDRNTIREFLTSPRAKKLRVLDKDGNDMYE